MGLIFVKTETLFVIEVVLFDWTVFGIIVKILSKATALIYIR
jgi:hypothetical protein